MISFFNFFIIFIKIKAKIFIILACLKEFFKKKKKKNFVINYYKFIIKKIIKYIIIEIKVDNSFFK